MPTKAGWLNRFPTDYVFRLLAKPHAALCCIEIEIVSKRANTHTHTHIIAKRRDLGVQTSVHEFDCDCAKITVI